MGNDFVKTRLSIMGTAKFFDYSRLVLLIQVREAALLCACLIRMLVKNQSPLGCFFRYVATKMNYASV